MRSNFIDALHIITRDKYHHLILPPPVDVLQDGSTNVSYEDTEQGNSPLACATYSINICITFFYDNTTACMGVISHYFGVLFDLSTDSGGIADIVDVTNMQRTQTQRESDLLTAVDMLTALHWYTDHGAQLEVELWKVLSTIMLHVAGLEDQLPQQRQNEDYHSNVMKVAMFAKGFRARFALSFLNFMMKKCVAEGSCAAAAVKGMLLLLLQ